MSFRAVSQKFMEIRDSGFMGYQLPLTLVGIHGLIRQGYSTLFHAELIVSRQWQKVRKLDQEPKLGYSDSLMDSHMDRKHVEHYRLMYLIRQRCHTCQSANYHMSLVAKYTNWAKMWFLALKRILVSQDSQNTIHQLPHQPESLTAIHTFLVYCWIWRNKLSTAENRKESNGNNIMFDYKNVLQF